MPKTVEKDDRKNQCIGLVLIFYEVTYMSTKIEVTMISEIDHSRFGCWSTVVNDKFVIRRELIGHDGGKFPWVPFLAVGTDVLEQEFVALDRRLPDSLQNLIKW